MKTQFLICLLLCGRLYSAYSQTELCIVGTTHEKSSYFNSDSVYNILQRVKPDVVLIELDSIFFTKDFRFNLDKYPDLLSTNENIGANKYHSDYKVDLRPFDMTGRNEYYRKTNYFENQNKMFEDIRSLYKKNELSKKDKEDFELILYALEVGSKVTFRSAQDLNSDVSEKFWSLRQKILYPKMVSIVENTEQLHHWIDFAREWASHWHKRNEIMVDNIIKIANGYKNKRIVVLVGNEHKSGLLDLLKSKDPGEFLIREYWTY